MSGGKIQFTATEYRISEKGNWTGLPLAVERVGGTDGEASVVVRNTSSSSSGRGKRDEDYSSPGASETLTWASGESGIKYPSFNVIDDMDVEDNESIPLSLSNIVNAEYGELTKAEILIISDDWYIPRHQWVNGTKLQFQQADGTWGTPVDLKGPPGVDGKDGVWGQFEMVNLPLAIKLISTTTQNDIQFNCEYRQQNLFLHSSGGVVSFWGEIHVENLQIINPFDEVDDGNNYRDYELYSQYSTLLFELAGIKNETPTLSPAVVSGEFYSGIKDHQTNNQTSTQISANASLTMVVPAYSNLAWVEYWRSETWKNQIMVVSNQTAAFHLSFSGRLIGYLL